MVQEQRTNKAKKTFNLVLIIANHDILSFLKGRFMIDNLVDFISQRNGMVDGWLWFESVVLALLRH